MRKELPNPAGSAGMQPPCRNQILINVTDHCSTLTNAPEWYQILAHKETRLLRATSNPRSDLQEAYASPISTSLPSPSGISQNP